MPQGTELCQTVFLWQMNALKGKQDIICIWWRNPLHPSVQASLCFYSWSLADNYSRIIGSLSWNREAWADGSWCWWIFSGRKEHFKGCYRSANCFSTPDNPLIIFSIIWCFASLLLGDLSTVPCHPKRAGQRGDMCGYHSARPFHKFIPMDHSTELRFHSGALFITSCMWVTAAPVRVRGCGYLCHRERVHIQVTVVVSISEILIFIKTNHFGPT